MTKDDCVKYLMSEEFNDCLASGEFLARWNTMLVELKFSLMTAEECAYTVGVPFDVFRHLWAHHEMLRLQGKTFEDVEREWAQAAKAKAN